MHRVRAKRHEGIGQQVMGLVPAERQSARIVVGCVRGNIEGGACRGEEGFSCRDRTGETQA